VEGILEIVILAHVTQSLANSKSAEIGESELGSTESGQQQGQGSHGQYTILPPTSTSVHTCINSDFTLISSPGQEENV
jgi:hypothetical protein